MWSAPFKPNLMNTVVFLVETAQIVAVLFVNYKGRPWMKGVTENHALFLSIFACVAGVAFCAWEASPMVNKMIHLYVPWVNPVPVETGRCYVCYVSVACGVHGYLEGCRSHSSVPIVPRRACRRLWHRFVSPGILSPMTLSAGR